MKRIIILLAGITMAFTSQAQDSTQAEKTDTIKIGNMIIIKKPGAKDENSSVDRKYRRTHYKPTNVSTSWFLFDIGVSQFRDETNYANAIANGYLPAGANEDWFNLRNGKSINFNLWVLMQRVNLIKHVVNLKYGAGIELNNYRYTETIKFQEGKTPLVVNENTLYKKNKLAADYITVPVMLNFNFTPQRKNGFGFSAGVSAGYLYSARQKIVTEAEGKKKYREGFDLRDWKISYIGELNLGPIKFYGSYANKSMFKNSLDQTPYTVGFRWSNW